MFVLYLFVWLKFWAMTSVLLMDILFHDVRGMKMMIDNPNWKDHVQKTP